MRFIASSALLGALASFASAFPAAYLKEAFESDPQFAELLTRQVKTADQATAIFEPQNTFDAEKQYVDVSEGSGHEFKAPGPNDLRGPCPGLNAFANHGFIPHNGYATISQFVEATTTVVGMGPVLALALSLLGGLQGGDGLSWSIGGKPPLGVGGPLARLGGGLDNLHNRYETDASPTRPDFYQDGNNFKVKTNQAQQLLDASPNDEITINTLMAFRQQRFDNQIGSNPYFFNGPFSGLLVQPAAYTFIYRFMANHSEADPTGLLSHDTFKSWFGLEGTNGNLKVNPGGERIPENWYRRSQNYPYELTYFVADVLNAAVAYPKFLSVGGNTGKTNSYAAVDITNLTGGLLNGAGLLQGNNLACFALQVAMGARLDIVPALLAPLAQITNRLGDLLGPLTCPQLRKINDSELKQFPGYTRSQ